MRSIPYRPFEQRPKASEWRWLEYSEGVPEGGRPPTALYTLIKKLRLVDQGTGSTFSALADRGLVEVNWHGCNVDWTPGLAIDQTSAIVAPCRQARAAAEVVGAR